MDGGGGAGDGSGGGGGATDQDLLVGSFISLALKSGELIDGVILAALGDDETGNGYDIRILKSNHVNQVVYRHRKAEEDLIDPKKSVIDLPSILAREEAALRKAEEQAKRIGNGVTVEGQYIFDILSKTYDVKWDKTDIVMFDIEVRICSPYLPENVNGGTPAANERIKKVLERINLAVLEIFCPDKR